jgi:hypothetical protein
MGQASRTGYNGTETTLTAATLAHLTVRRQLHAWGPILALPGQGRQQAKYLGFVLLVS